MADPSTVPQGEPQTPAEAAALLTRARAQFEEGRLNPGEYLAMQERYGPLAEKAAAELGPREVRAQRLRGALGTLGAALLAVALFLMVTVLAEDQITPASQLMLLFASSLVIAVLGLSMRRNAGQEGTAYALLGVSAILLPLSAALAYNAWPDGPGRGLMAFVAIAAPAALLHLTHTEHREGPALTCFIGLGIGLVVALRLIGVESPVAVAYSLELLWGILLAGLLVLRDQERPAEWRWYEGGIGTLAVLGGPLFVRGFQVYGFQPFGEYTGMMVLLLLGSAFLFYGILDAFGASAVAGAILLAASALWMGGFMGDTPGAVVALLLVSALLIGASQLVGVDRMRTHFGQR